MYFKKTDNCYFCKSVGSSEEHIPPKCIYPEAKDLPGTFYREDLIWVPSCDLHNLYKSDDDEYLMLVMVLNDFSNNIAIQLGKTKVLRICKKYLGKIKKTFTNPTDIEKVLHGEPITYDVDITRIKEIFRKIACGLFLWKYKQYINPDYLEVVFIDLKDRNTNQHYNLALRNSLIYLFDSIEKEGPHQEIFYYQFYEDDKKMIRLVFYEGYNAVITING